MSKLPPYRRLTDLPGIGRAMAGDYRRLGIETVADVASADPDDLYDRIQLLDGPTDPCVLYTFHGARYAAATAEPDPALLRWWTWKEPTVRAAHSGLHREG